MSDIDNGAGSEPTGAQPPEFVAVTSRRVLPEPPQAHEEAPTADAPTGTDPDGPPDAGIATGAAADPEPAQEADPQPPAAPAPASEPAPTDATTVQIPAAGTEGAPAGEAGSVEQPPATPLAEQPEAQSSATEPAPESPVVPEAPPEVPVRIAADGMADALAGLPERGPEADRPRRVGPLQIATAICVILAIAACALLAVTAHSNSHRRAVAAARAEVLAAAKREAAPFLTYDYRTFDRDIARAEAGLSTRFRANYAHTTATEVRALALKNHSSSHATVVAAGVVSAGSDRAKVLVFVDQVVQNSLLQATSRLDQTQIELSMVKQGGRWVIDDVTTF